MAQPTLRHSELDALLEPALASPDSFPGIALAVIHTLDQAGTCLDIKDSDSWRREPRHFTNTASASFLNQFRADVDRIEVLDRKEEGHLARRIEFARLRLGVAMEANDINEQQVHEGIAHTGLGWNNQVAQATIAASDLPRQVAQRWVELHALRTELVERNLYLVLMNVERYTHTGASRVDLIQEGSIALYRAVDGFDWRRGLLFRTYAVHWLNQAFRNHLYNFGHTVRVPIYLQKIMKQVNEAKIRLGDPKASSAEIAQEGELDEHLVDSALSATRMSLSLDAEFNSAAGTSRLGDFLEDEHTIEDDLNRMDRVNLERDLGAALADLRERERFVVTQRFGLGNIREHTLAEVSLHLGVSVERVRQIQMTALRKLSSPDLRKQFAAYLN
ncbi:MAG: RNA polymerase primary sigma factor [Planctomycetota bacterium]|jgi:RNA polymerase primary sigma factor